MKLSDLLKYMTIGNGLVGKFLTPINFAMIFMTFIKVYGINLSIAGTVLLFGVALSSSIFLGWFYDIAGLWKKEIEFDTERNPMMKEIKEVKKLLEGFV
jgi:hypothetical protein